MTGWRCCLLSSCGNGWSEDGWLIRAFTFAFFKNRVLLFLLVHSSCVLLFGISCSSFEFGVLLPLLILFHSIIFFDSIHRHHSSSSSRAIPSSLHLRSIAFPQNSLHSQFASIPKFTSHRPYSARNSSIHSSQPFLIIHHHHLHVLAISRQSTYLFSRVPQAAIIYIGYPVPLFQFFSAFPLRFLHSTKECSHFVGDYNDTSLSPIYYNPYMLYAYYNVVARQQLRCALNRLCTISIYESVTILIIGFLDLDCGCDGSGVL